MESVKIHRRLYTLSPISNRTHALMHSGRVFPLHVNLQQGLASSGFTRTTQLSV